MLNTVSDCGRRRCYQAGRGSQSVCCVEVEVMLYSTVYTMITAGLCLCLTTGRMWECNRPEVMCAWYLSSLCTSLESVSLFGPSLCGSKNRVWISHFLSSMFSQSSRPLCSFWSHFTLLFENTVPTRQVENSKQKIAYPKECHMGCKIHQFTDLVQHKMFAGRWCYCFRYAYGCTVCWCWWLLHVLVNLLALNVLYVSRSM